MPFHQPGRAFLISGIAPSPGDGVKTGTGEYHHDFGQQRAGNRLCDQIIPGVGVQEQGVSGIVRRKRIRPLITSLEPPIWSFLTAVLYGDHEDAHLPEGK
jgi:hypothetical protein